MATVRTWERRYLFIFASQKRSLAKTQRVDEHASLIYKTAFLLIQKIGPKTEIWPPKRRVVE
ncbi:hypothetical protein [Klebsiella oxytoca]|uniref:hypothetical protein n=1 Tax=Klebsiella oxytoca TaxID=571 RepID=UPI0015F6DC5A|nr:hypothetical protein [Klebsiella oxytoca]EGT0047517.1 hypothetical protein [Klebsiella oxytoca]EJY1760019.1 hypothetical protein [Klebsiella oxytoca]EKT8240166.1 hypothetical protein [Klebsiella oxytoca]ELI6938341.1 hypothetical protein [Klebsiella oxytoca]ELP0882275.1 hypothetical protein [Klebsiella oxytoca]